MITPPMVPSEAVIARLEQAGRVLTAYGGIFVTAVIIGIYFGWLDSPLMQGVRANTLLLQQHALSEAEVARIRLEAIRVQTEEAKRMTDALERIIRILKILDCGGIPDKTLRDRCMSL